MFKKKERLSRNEFDAVYKNGRRIGSDCFLCITMPASDTKVAVVVGKKTARHANKRNALRRSVFDVLNIMKKHILHTHTVVVVLKNATHISKKEFKETLIKQLHRI